MKVVIDTTIIISAFISKESAPNQAIDLWFQKEYTLVTSTWQIEEIREVTKRDHTKALINPNEVGRFINLLKEKAIVLEDLPEVEHSPDPDDNPILAAAIATQSKYLVSGDKKHLLILEKIKGVSIITAREFVDLFE